MSTTTATRIQPMELRESDDGIATGSDAMLPCFSATNCSTQSSLMTSSQANQSGLSEVALTISLTYTIICLLGLLGNGLVIYVVLRYAKMKTVTNTYIVNLAVADTYFLAGLPFLVTTVLVQRWVFGHLMCKVFYILTCITFTSFFTLTMMSADRYLAVCHPVWSINYRTPEVAKVVCLCVWALSGLAMTPIIVFADLRPIPGRPPSCSVDFPPIGSVPPENAFILYALVVGFAFPVALSTVFYSLVVIRLGSLSRMTSSEERARSRRKVTRMVLTVVAVYVTCWLPYWACQVVVQFSHLIPPTWLMHTAAVLSYANSSLNPVLYAFLSENFRQSFAKTVRCCAAAMTSSRNNLDPNRPVTTAADTNGGRQARSGTPSPRTDTAAANRRSPRFIDNESEFEVNLIDSRSTRSTRGDSSSASGLASRLLTLANPRRAKAATSRSSSASSSQGQRSRSLIQQSGTDKPNSYMSIAEN